MRIPDVFISCRPKLAKYGVGQPAPRAPGGYAYCVRAYGTRYRSSVLYCVHLHKFRIARLSGFIAHMDDMLFAFGPSASEECASRGRRDYRTQYSLSLSLLENLLLLTTTYFPRRSLGVSPL